MDAQGDLWEQEKSKWSQETVDTSQTYKGKIEKIALSTAGEMFGEGAKDNPDRKVAVVTIGFMLGSNKASFSETFSLPTSALSWLSPKFKLGQFRTRYGKDPVVGQEVSIYFTREKYPRILL